MGERERGMGGVLPSAWGEGVCRVAHCGGRRYCRGGG